MLFRRSWLVNWISMTKNRLVMSIRILSCCYIGLTRKRKPLHTGQIPYQHHRFSTCRKRWLSFLVLLISLLGISVVNAEPQRLRVGFLCPKPPEHPFWGQVIRVMQAAANDLDIELIIQCSQRGTVATKRLGDKFINSEPKLDYLLTKYWTSVTKYHLPMAKERGIQVFIFNSNVVPEDIEQVGKPREIYSNWIGHMVPDDEQAGMQLAGMLLDRRNSQQQANQSKNPRLLVLKGKDSAPVSRLRNKGLHRQLENTPGIVPTEVALEYWTDDWAQEETLKALKQQPQINMIWASNQAIAWGAVRGVEKLGKIPGKDIFVGGFDWNAESLPAIEDGRLSVTMFGQFLEGAWSLILLHDYHYGYDFADDAGVQILTPLVPMTAANYKAYQKLLTEEFWESVDFKQYSKKYNPNLKKYNFSIEQFLNN